MWCLLRKTKPLLSSKRRPLFQTINVLGINRNVVVSPDGTRSHE
jgi:hypothetical protein